MMVLSLLGKWKIKEDDYEKIFIFASTRIFGY